MTENNQFKELFMNVDPQSIVDLAREIYHYEENENKATDLLKCFKGLSGSQIYQIIWGFATFTTTNIEGVFKYTPLVDAQFRNKLCNHINSHKYRCTSCNTPLSNEQESDDQPPKSNICIHCNELFCDHCLDHPVEDESPICKECAEEQTHTFHAQKHLDPCNDENCKFRGPRCKGESQPICGFGPRNNLGCYMEDDAIDERLEDITAISMMNAKLQAEGIINESLAKTSNLLANKTFNFVFNGHEYRASDNARDQTRCPHCDQIHSLNLSDPEIGYIGEHRFNDDEVAKCFECQHCFKKFIYHWSSHKPFNQPSSLKTPSRKGRSP